MLKYSLGLDISANSIQCCISVIDEQQKVTVKSSRKISNNTKGFEELTTWISKHCKEKDVPLSVNMEATGIYYENCALYLYQKGFNVSVILPNKAKKYLQAIGQKSKNDSIDAQGLSRMGAEQSLDLWQPMGEYYYLLRKLTRQYQSLQELKTNVSNQLHAETNGMYESQDVTEQLTTLISTLVTQIKAMEKLIKEHIESDESVSQKVSNISKIKGVGLQTVAVVLAETNGFLLFKNSRQLVSYAGYDIVQNQSGSHNGRTRISKKGNSRLRKAMHMPSLSLIQHKVKPFFNLYERTLKKHYIKMKSYVAVQKKLLVLIYSLWSNNTPFNENHGLEISGYQEPELSLGSSAVAEAE